MVLFRMLLLMPALVFALLVPAALVLPALGTVSIVVAGALGLYAWWSGAALEGDSFTAWDLSGAFVMVACAAGILSEPEHVARFVTGLTAISK